MKEYYRKDGADVTQDLAAIAKQAQAEERASKQQHQAIADLEYMASAKKIEDKARFESAMERVESAAAGDSSLDKEVILYKDSVKGVILRNKEDFGAEYAKMLRATPADGLLGTNLGQLDAAMEGTAPWVRDFARVTGDFHIVPRFNEAMQTATGGTGEVGDWGVTPFTRHDSSVTGASRALGRMISLVSDNFNGFGLGIDPEGWFAGQEDPRVVDGKVIVDVKADDRTFKFQGLAPGGPLHTLMYFQDPTYTEERRNLWAESIFSDPATAQLYAEAGLTPEDITTAPSAVAAAARIEYKMNARLASGYASVAGGWATAGHFIRNLGASIVTDPDMQAELAIGLATGGVSVAGRLVTAGAGKLTKVSKGIETANRARMVAAGANYNRSISRYSSAGYAALAKGAEGVGYTTQKAASLARNLNPFQVGERIILRSAQAVKVLKGGTGAVKSKRVAALVDSSMLGATGKVAKEVLLGNSDVTMRGTIVANMIDGAAGNFAAYAASRDEEWLWAKATLGPDADWNAVRFQMTNGQDYGNSGFGAITMGAVFGASIGAVMKGIGIATFDPNGAVTAPKAPGSDMPIIRNPVRTLNELRKAKNAQVFGEVESSMLEVSAYGPKQVKQAYSAVKEALSRGNATGAEVASRAESMLSYAMAQGVNLAKVIRNATDSTDGSISLKSLRDAVTEDAKSPRAKRRRLAAKNRQRTAGASVKDIRTANTLNQLRMEFLIENKRTDWENASEIEMIDYAISRSKEEGRSDVAADLEELKSEAFMFSTKISDSIRGSIAAYGDSFKSLPGVAQERAARTFLEAAGIDGLDMTAAEIRTLLPDFEGRTDATAERLIADKILKDTNDDLGISVVREQLEPEAQVAREMEMDRAGLRFLIDVEKPDASDATRNSALFSLKDMANLTNKNVKSFKKALGRKNVDAEADKVAEDLEKGILTKKAEDIKRYIRDTHGIDLTTVDQATDSNIRVLAGEGLNKEALIDLAKDLARLDVYSKAIKSTEKKADVSLMIQAALGDPAAQKDIAVLWQRSLREVADNGSDIENDMISVGNLTKNGGVPEGYEGMLDTVFGEAMARDAGNQYYNIKDMLYIAEERRAMADAQYRTELIAARSKRAEKMQGTFEGKVFNRIMDFQNKTLMTSSFMDARSRAYTAGVDPRAQFEARMEEDPQYLNKQKVRMVQGVIEGWNSLPRGPLRDRLAVKYGLQDLNRNASYTDPNAEITPEIQAARNQAPLSLWNGIHEELGVEGVEIKHLLDGTIDAANGYVLGRALVEAASGKTTTRRESAQARGVADVDVEDGKAVIPTRGFLGRLNNESYISLYQQHVRESVMDFVLDMGTGERVVDGKTLKYLTKDDVDAVLKDLNEVSKRITAAAKAGEDIPADIMARLNPVGYDPAANMVLAPKAVISNLKKKIKTFRSTVEDSVNDILDAPPGVINMLHDEANVNNNFMAARFMLGKTTNEKKLPEEVSADGGMESAAVTPGSFLSLWNLRISQRFGTAAGISEAANLMGMKELGAEIDRIRASDGDDAAVRELQDFLTADDDVVLKNAQDASAQAVTLARHFYTDYAASGRPGAKDIAKDGEAQKEFKKVLNEAREALYSNSGQERRDRALRAYTDNLTTEEVDKYSKAGLAGLRSFKSSGWKGLVDLMGDLEDLQDVRKITNSGLGKWARNELFKPPVMTIVYGAGGKAFKSNTRKALDMLLKDPAAYGLTPEQVAFLKDSKVLSSMADEFAKEMLGSYEYTQDGRTFKPGIIQKVLKIPSTEKLIEMERDRPISIEVKGEGTRLITMQDMLSKDAILDSRKLEDGRTVGDVIASHLTKYALEVFDVESPELGLWLAKLKMINDGAREKRAIRLMQDKVVQAKAKASESGEYTHAKFVQALHNIYAPEISYISTIRSANRLGFDLDPENAKMVMNELGMSPENLSPISRLAFEEATPVFQTTGGAAGRKFGVFDGSLIIRNQNNETTVGEAGGIEGVPGEGLNIGQMRLANALADVGGVRMDEASLKDRVRAALTFDLLTEVGSVLLPKSPDGRVMRAPEMSDFYRDANTAEGRTAADRNRAALNYNTRIAELTEDLEAAKADMESGRTLSKEEMDSLAQKNKTLATLKQLGKTVYSKDDNGNVRLSSGHGLLAANMSAKAQLGTSYDGENPTSMGVPYLQKTAFDLNNRQMRQFRRDSKQPLNEGLAYQTGELLTASPLHPEFFSKARAEGKPVRSQNVLTLQEEANRDDTSRSDMAIKREAQEDRALAKENNTTVQSIRLGRLMDRIKADTSRRLAAVGRIKDPASREAATEAVRRHSRNMVVQGFKNTMGTDISEREAKVKSTKIPAKGKFTAGANNALQMLQGYTRANEVRELAGVLLGASSRAGLDLNVTDAIKEGSNILPRSDARGPMTVFATDWEAMGGSAMQLPAVMLLRIADYRKISYKDMARRLNEGFEAELGKYLKDKYNNLESESDRLEFADDSRDYMGYLDDALERKLKDLGTELKDLEDKLSAELAVPMPELDGRLDLGGKIKFSSVMNELKSNPENLEFLRKVTGIENLRAVDVAAHYSLSRTELQRLMEEDGTQPVFVPRQKMTEDGPEIDDQELTYINMREIADENVAPGTAPMHTLSQMLHMLNMRSNRSVVTNMMLATQLGLDFDVNQRLDKRVRETVDAFASDESIHGFARTPESEEGAAKLINEDPITDNPLRVYGSTVARELRLEMRVEPPGKREYPDAVTGLAHILWSSGLAEKDFISGDAEKLILRSGLTDDFSREVLEDTLNQLHQIEVDAVTAKANAEAAEAARYNTEAEEANVVYESDMTDYAVDDNGNLISVEPEFEAPTPKAEVSKLDDKIKSDVQKIIDTSYVDEDTRAYILSVNKRLRKRADQAAKEKDLATLTDIWVAQQDLARAAHREYRQLAEWGSKRTADGGGKIPRLDLAEKRIEASYKPLFTNSKHLDRLFKDLGYNARGLSKPSNKKSVVINYAYKGEDFTIRKDGLEESYLENGGVNHLIERDIEKREGIDDDSPKFVATDEITIRDTDIVDPESSSAPEPDAGTRTAEAEAPALKAENPKIGDKPFDPVTKDPGLAHLVKNQLKSINAMIEGTYTGPTDYSGFAKLKYVADLAKARGKASVTETEFRKAIEYHNNRVGQPQEKPRIDQAIKQVADAGAKASAPIDPDAVVQVDIVAQPGREIGDAYFSSLMTTANGTGPNAVSARNAAKVFGALTGRDGYPKTEVSDTDAMVLMEMSYNDPTYQRALWGGDLEIDDEGALRAQGRIVENQLQTRIAGFGRVKDLLGDQNISAAAYLLLHELVERLDLASTLRGKMKAGEGAGAVAKISRFFIENFGNNEGKLKFVGLLEKLGLKNSSSAMHFLAKTVEVTGEYNLSAVKTLGPDLREAAKNLKNNEVVTEGFTQVLTMALFADRAGRMGEFAEIYGNDPNLTAASNQIRDKLSEMQEYMRVLTRGQEAEESTRFAGQLKSGQDITNYQWSFFTPSSSTYLRSVLETITQLDRNANWGGEYRQKTMAAQSRFFGGDPDSRPREDILADIEAAKAKLDAPGKEDRVAEQLELSRLQNELGVLDRRETGTDPESERKFYMRVANATQEGTDLIQLNRLSRADAKRVTDERIDQLLSEFGAERSSGIGRVANIGAGFFSAGRGLAAGANSRSNTIRALAAMINPEMVNTKLVGGQTWISDQVAMDAQSRDYRLAVDGLAPFRHRSKKRTGDTRREYNRKVSYALEETDPAKRLQDLKDLDFTSKEAMTLTQWHDNVFNTKSGMIPRLARLMAISGTLSKSQAEAIAASPQLPKMLVRELVNEPGVADTIRAELKRLGHKRAQKVGVDNINVEMADAYGIFMNTSNTSKGLEAEFNEMDASLQGFYLGLYKKYETKAEELSLKMPIHSESAKFEKAAWASDRMKEELSKPADMRDVVSRAVDKGTLVRMLKKAVEKDKALASSGMRDSSGKIISSRVKQINDAFNETSLDKYNPEDLSVMDYFANKELVDLKTGGKLGPSRFIGDRKRAFEKSDILRRFEDADPMNRLTSTLGSSATYAYATSIQQYGSGVQGLGTTQIIANLRQRAENDELNLTTPERKAFLRDLMNLEDQLRAGYNQRPKSIEDDPSDMNRSLMALSRIGVAGTSAGNFFLSAFVEVFGGVARSMGKILTGDLAAIGDYFTALSPTARKRLLENANGFELAKIHMGINTRLGDLGFDDIEAMRNKENGDWVDKVESAGRKMTNFAMMGFGKATEYSRAVSTAQAIRATRKLAAAKAGGFEGAAKALAGINRRDLDLKEAKRIGREAGLPADVTAHLYQNGQFRAPILLDMQTVVTDSRFFGTEGLDHIAIRETLGHRADETVAALTGIMQFLNGKMNLDPRMGNRQIPRGIIQQLLSVLGQFPILFYSRMRQSAWQGGALGVAGFLLPMLLGEIYYSTLQQMTMGEKPSEVLDRWKKDPLGALLNVVENMNLLGGASSVMTTASQMAVSNLRALTGNPDLLEGYKTSHFSKSMINAAGIDMLMGSAGKVFGAAEDFYNGNTDRGFQRLSSATPLPMQQLVKMLLLNDVMSTSEGAALLSGGYSAPQRGYGGQSGPSPALQAFAAARAQRPSTGLTEEAPSTAPVKPVPKPSNTDPIGDSTSASGDLADKLE